MPCIRTGRWRRPVTGRDPIAPSCLTGGMLRKPVGSEQRHEPAWDALQHRRTLRRPDDELEALVTKPPDGDDDATAHFQLVVERRWERRRRRGDGDCGKGRLPRHAQRAVAEVNVYLVAPVCQG